MLIALVDLGVSQSVPGSYLADQLLDTYIRFPSATERSRAQTEDATAVVAKLKSADRRVTNRVILERLANARGHDLSKYRDLLKEMGPGLKGDFFTRASAESIPAKKRPFIRAADVFWGQDALRFLVAQLVDKRPADPRGDFGPRSLRVCDIAVNVLDKNIGKDLDIHIGFGTGGGDTIVHDVPVSQRDEWIAKFREALIRKYGPDLKLPELSR